MKYKDYYKILGVPRGASSDEIKQAYRRLAREHHPDLHPDKDKAEHTKAFQVINEAYEVLGSAENRAKYDQLGEHWKDGQAFRPPPAQERARDSFRFETGASGDEIFSDFFRSFFGGGHAGGRWSAPPASLDIEAVIELSLEEAVRGGERSFSMSVTGVCPKCLGAGHAGKAFCPACGGAGETRSAREIRSRLPSDLRDGSRIRLKGQGNKSGDGQPPGDLYLTVRLKPDPRFKVSGSDIETAVRVMPWDAALGAEVLVPTPLGRVRIRVPKGTRAGTRLRIPGKGLGGGRRGRGDLYARIEVDIPSELSHKAEALMGELKKEHQNAAG
ncbi:MAG: J domain-containing protein [Elusimicrobiota bacterium]